MNARAVTALGAGPGAVAGTACGWAAAAAVVPARTHGLEHGWMTVIAALVGGSAGAAIGGAGAIRLTGHQGAMRTAAMLAWMVPAAAPAIIWVSAVLSPLAVPLVIGVAVAARALAEGAEGGRWP